MWRDIYTSSERGVRYLINDNRVLPETLVSLLYLIPGIEQVPHFMDTRASQLQSHCHFPPMRHLPEGIGFVAEINHVDKGTGTVLSGTGRTCSCACKC